MNKPLPEPISPEQVPDAARAVVAADRFPSLATLDGQQPRVRPVSPVKTDGFTIYVANLRQYHKTQEIEANPRVELCYLSDTHDQVRITGTAVIEDRPEVLDDIWNQNPLLRQYLGSPDNPSLIIYRIEPTCVRFMREWALEYHDVPLTVQDSRRREANPTLLSEYGRILLTIRPVDTDLIDSLVALLQSNQIQCNPHAEEFASGDKPHTPRPCAIVLLGEWNSDTVEAVLNEWKSGRD
ncbi:MAG: pyridoxamine 5'-phosphate oxidase family protein [Planctomycetaceae bacterium]|nr:pyridoxamine 5'-phosphate oxidase family protein [Planctomycetaceae bacterium]